MAISDSVALFSSASAQDGDSFFRSYSWCLNPILSVQRQLHRLREELTRLATINSEWQKKECETNIYLFVCSIACTVDDYLAWRLYDFSPLCARFGRMGLVLRPAESLVNLVAARICRPGTRVAIRWRQAWGSVVDRACELLTADSEPAHWADLSGDIEALAAERLPAPLLARKLRIPEAFRCQDLAHHDVFTLVNRLMELPIDRSAPAVVVGPRTAGAYMAPLAGACLRSAGWADVSWFTVRPRNGISRREARNLAGLVNRPSAHVILIDDFPNTGGTHRKLLHMLYGMGVLPQQVVVLSPRHPHRPDWSLPEEIGRGIRIITVEPAGLYKAKLLDDVEWVEAVLNAYYRRHGWDRVRVQQSPRTRTLNDAIEAQLSQGFHVRLKRVFDVELQRGSARLRVQVLAKSVGWGWFGYHGYIAGTRLSGFVPDVIGSRDGFLFCRWIDSADKNPSGTRIGAYVARRTNALPLDEDPVLGSVGYRWVGWNEMLEMVRGVYGPYLNRIKVPAIRRHLAKHLNPVRTMVDGQMKREDWVGTGSEACKTDFEQHNFGGPELDFVDPAFDLAGAIFEFEMGQDAEESMLAVYMQQTGDWDVHNRITLFKSLYGTMVLKRTADALSWGGSREKMRGWEELNRRAREFLTTHVNRYCASLAGGGKQSWPWSDRVFFMDLDGVFYGTQLGFPHPTPRTVAAIETLRSSEIAVVVNTARDAGHVREFCRLYGIPGGLAESGSVFVDAVGSRELTLIDDHAATQIVRLRDALRRVNGIYVDDAYRYSVRACRIQNGKRAPLDREETERLLHESGLDRLSVFDEATHTDIVQRGIDKGTGVCRVLELLGISPERACAIGHSGRDIPMLNACVVRYAPAKRSRAVRNAVPLHMALESAARDFAAQHGRLKLAPVKPGDALEPLLRVADRSPMRQLASLVFLKSL